MRSPLPLDTAGTILDCLTLYATTQPHAKAYTYLSNGGDQEYTLTYKELHDRAIGYASVLYESGLSGKNVLLLFPTGLDFIIGFFACGYSGAVAVPANIARNSHHYSRLKQIVVDAGAAAVLTVAELESSIARGLFDSGVDTESLTLLCESKVSSATPLTSKQHKPEHLAFIQYTSGSTGAPKGVMISHAQLIANEKAIQSVSQLPEHFVGGGWLPQFHDMGLIGALLQPIALGGHYVFISPLHFLQKPLRWLELLSRYKAVATAAPNFALELCIKSEVNNCALAALDLSALEVIFCGAEPIHSASLKNFEHKFSKYGLRSNAIKPCYGLAEATLIVSGGISPTGRRTFPLNRQALENGEIESANDSDPTAQNLVSCGPPVVDHHVIIVNPETGCVMGEHQVGEIWFSGPSVASGYWGNPQASAATFEAMTECGKGPYMRTGDMGFLTDKGLFISGRIKELMILRGRNFYPYDIESTLLGTTILLNDAQAVVFAVETANSPKIVAYIELPRRNKSTLSLDFQKLSRQLRAAVTTVHDLLLDDLFFVYQGVIPRTSSGKTQRHKCAEFYTSNFIDHEKYLLYSTRPSQTSCIEAVAP